MEDLIELVVRVSVDGTATIVLSSASAASGIVAIKTREVLRRLRDQLDGFLYTSWIEFEDDAPPEAATPEGRDAYENDGVFEVAPWMGQEVRS